MQTVQLALDPSFPSLILSDLGIMAMGPAPTWCEQCSMEVMPEPREEDETWILFPCHQIECSQCYEIEDKCSTCETGQCGCDCWHCDGCEVFVSHDDSYPCSNCGMCNGGCCECYYCTSCDQMFSGEWFCGECEKCENDCTCSSMEDDCNCSDCRPYSSGRGTVPGWIRRGDTLPIVNGDATDSLRDHLDIDPVQAMADFYLADFVTFVIGNRPSLRTPAHREIAQLRNDAYRLQSHLVARCDAAFRAYGFLAIGGEVRHHRNIRDTGALPTSRETSWDYWSALGDTVGHALLLEDAMELFGDGTWSSGYGGKKWHDCTSVLLARENGILDSKTFVDRVFSLQHNGGSFLNKSLWASKTVAGWDVSYCRDIGNAHAARNTDFGILLGAASEDVKSLVRDLVQRHSWTFHGSKLMGKSDKLETLEALKRALGIETLQERAARSEIELARALRAIDEQYASS